MRGVCANRRGAAQSAGVANVRVLCESARSSAIGGWCRCVFGPRPRRVPRTRNNGFSQVAFAALGVVGEPLARKHLDAVVEMQLPRMGFPVARGWKTVAELWLNALRSTADEVDFSCEAEFAESYKAEFSLHLRVQSSTRQTAHETGSRKRMRSVSPIKANGGGGGGNSGAKRVCYAWVKGTCRKGAGACKFAHSVQENEIPSLAKKLGLSESAVRNRNA